MTIYFDPNAPAKTTDTLQVEMVFRVSTGEIFEVKSWLPTQTDGNIHLLRNKIRQKTDNENFLCFCCGHNVLLRKRNGGHYFAHKEKTAGEKAKCIYQQNHLISLEDRDRLRYHGQREGQRHIKTKRFIDQILRSDPRFSEPKIEKVWTTFSDGWRKPDVASSWSGQPVVFEAQVSNTYPHIVAERTDYYRKQGVLLIWIYDQLAETEWRTLHADTFCSNGQHLFTVDEECVSFSKDQKQAYFRIYSQMPEVIPFKDQADDPWRLHLIQEKSFSLVPFSSLSLDIEAQTATWFDFKKRQNIAEHKILCADAQAKCSCLALENSVKKLIGEDRPLDINNIKGWAALICGIESKRLGKPIGTRFSNVVGVLSLVYDHYPNFYPHLVDTLDRLKLDPPELRVGAWKERVNKFYENRSKGEPAPKPHKKAGDLLNYLYS